MYRGVQTVLVWVCVLAWVMPARAERVSIAQGNPVAMLSDSQGQETLGCFLRSDHKKHLLLFKGSKLAVGKRLTGILVSSKVLATLVKATQRKITVSSRVQARAVRLKLLTKQKASLSFYRKASRYLSLCQRMKIQPAMSAPTPTPVPIVAVRSYAYSLWRDSDPSLSGLISGYRAWIFSNPDATTAKAALDQMPPGHRVLMDISSSQRILQDAISADPLDKCTDPVTHRQFSCFWWDHGVASVKPNYDQFYTELAAQGGQLDYIAIDLESGFGVFSFPYLGSDFDAFTRAVINDPRWPALHQELIDAGIPSSATLAEMFDFFRHQYYLIFDDVMKRRSAAYAEQALVNTARAHFPNVQVSNFGYYNVSASYPVREYNGHPEWIGGNGAIVGTNQGAVLYGSIAGLANYMLDGQNYYDATAFNAFRLDVNHARSSALGSNAPVDFWLAPRDWYASLYKDSGFFQETIIHALISGAQHVLYWNPSDINGVEESSAQKFAADKVVSDTMLEYEQYVGYSDRNSLVTDIQQWGDNFVLSCANANKKRTCRITGRDLLSLSSVNQSGTGTVVAQTSTTTISFANGIAYTTNATPFGCWIVQPLSAPLPVVRVRN